MTPIQYYSDALQSPDFAHDPAQEMAVKHLQRLYDELEAHQVPLLGSRSGSGFLGRFRKSAVKPVTGLYLWGGVGRGKTFLMDMFYETLPFEQKIRMHFHRFMQWVHHEMNVLQGRRDPLDTIADGLSAQARILCVDEFYVSDVGDAMILAVLLDKLFKKGVSLVATSNIVPDGLYRNGLQRERFLPAIDLLNRHTNVIELASETDYRLRTLETAEIYHCPLDDSALKVMEENFDHLAPEPFIDSEILEINGRQISTRRCADDVVWFDFDALCCGPRSQADYIEIAREYHAVLLSNVFQMTDDSSDVMRRFINMIDEFYDRNVKLIISAEVPIESLYKGERLGFEFERTYSRLHEMQSHDYLAREHRP